MKLKETDNLVTLEGKPLVLMGNQVRAGDAAPDFKAVDGSFKQVKLSDFKGRVCIVSAVPSLDTPVCSLQTKRFNSELANLPRGTAVLTVSMDLPFAQKRFCETEKTDRVTLLSDHVWRDFGTRYGLLIKDMGLLARAVFVIDGAGKVIHREIVAELAEQPDYDKVLAAARQGSRAP